MIALSWEYHGSKTAVFRTKTGFGSRHNDGTGLLKTIFVPPCGNDTLNFSWLTEPLTIHFRIWSMEKVYQYSFLTTWKLKAPVSAVWDLLYNTEDWPNWWKGVQKVEVLKEGDSMKLGQKTRYTWKSFLPYTLCFDMTSRLIEQPHLMEGLASGELEGIGVWVFTENDGITTVQYCWDVNTTKKWMNILSPVLKPFFKWNHDVVMKWGAAGLAKKLNAELISS